MVNRRGVLKNRCGDGGRLSSLFGGAVTEGCTSHFTERCLTNGSRSAWVLRPNRAAEESALPRFVAMLPNCGMTICECI